MIGLAVGRWWALIAAVVFGGWIWAVNEVEVPSWFLALAYGATAALGIALGVVARRALGTRRSG